jgi:hypothetical protein
VLDDGAGDEHGLHDGARRDLAGLADLVLEDVEESGHYAIGRVLEGDDPARALGGRAEGLLLEGVDADDHAVGRVQERAPLPVEVGEIAARISSTVEHV